MTQNSKRFKYHNEAMQLINKYDKHASNLVEIVQDKLIVHDKLKVQTN